MPTNCLRFSLLISFSLASGALADTLICSGAFDQFGSRDWSQRIAKYRAAHPSGRAQAQPKSKFKQTENKLETNQAETEEPKDEIKQNILPKEEL